jgi:hypothetical protein
MRAFTTKHETFATFLSEPLDGLQRWQMFMASCEIYAHISGAWRLQLTCAPALRRSSSL